MTELETPVYSTSKEEHRGFGIEVLDKNGKEVYKFSSLRAASKF